MKEISKEEKLKILLMAFLETWYQDVLQKYLKTSIDITKYNELSELLLGKTTVEVYNLFK